MVSRRIINLKEIFDFEPFPFQTESIIQQLVVDSTNGEGIKFVHKNFFYHTLYSYFEAFIHLRSLIATWSSTIIPELRKSHVKFLEFRKNNPIIQWICSKLNGKQNANASNRMRRLRNTEETPNVNLQEAISLGWTLCYFIQMASVKTHWIHA